MKLSIELLEITITILVPAKVIGLYKGWNETAKDSKLFSVPIMPKRQTILQWIVTISESRNDVIVGGREASTHINRRLALRRESCKAATSFVKSTGAT